MRCTNPKQIKYKAEQKQNQKQKQKQKKVCGRKSKR